MIYTTRMQPIEKRKAFDLQEIYLKTRDPRDFRNLLEEVRHIAAVMVNTLAKGSMHRISREKRAQVVLDTRNKIAEHYLGDPSYAVKSSFIAVVYNLCRSFLFYKSWEWNKYENNIADCDIDDLPRICPEPEIPEPLEPKGKSIFVTMVSDEPFGARIVSDIYVSHTQKEAVLKISKYKGERWCIDNIRLILHLYKRLRHPRGGKKWLRRVVQSGNLPLIRK